MSGVVEAPLRLHLSFEGSRTCAVRVCVGAGASLVGPNLARKYATEVEAKAKSILPPGASVSVSAGWEFVVLSTRVFPKDASRVLADLEQLATDAFKLATRTSAGAFMPEPTVRTLASEPYGAIALALARSTQIGALAAAQLANCQEDPTNFQCFAFPDRPRIVSITAGNCEVPLRTTSDPPPLPEANHRFRIKNWHKLAVWCPDSVESVGLALRLYGSAAENLIMSTAATRAATETLRGERQLVYGVLGELLDDGLGGSVWMARALTPVGYSEEVLSLLTQATMEVRPNQYDFLAAQVQTILACETAAGLADSQMSGLSWGMRPIDPRLVLTELAEIISGKSVQCERLLLASAVGQAGGSDPTIGAIEPLHPLELVTGETER